MQKKRKTAIITGVTSFLGRSVTTYLLSKGYAVFGIVRDKSEKMQMLLGLEGLKIIKLDFDTVKSNDFLCINDLTLAKSIEELKEKNYDITFIHFGWGGTLDRSNFMENITC